VKESIHAPSQDTRKMLFGHFVVDQRLLLEQPAQPLERRVRSQFDGRASATRIRTFK